MSEHSWLHSSPIKGLFKLEPDIALIRSAVGEETSSFAQLKLITQTPEGCAIAWKIRTNHPHRYMVSPKQGLLESGGIETITIAVSSSGDSPLTDADISKDKFLIEAMPISSESDRSLIRELNPLASAENTKSVWNIWDERGQRHDKKRGTFVFESRTVKCKMDMSASVTISKRPSDFAESTEHREKHFSGDSTLHRTITEDTRMVMSDTDEIIHDNLEEEKSDESKAEEISSRITNVDDDHTNDQSSSSMSTPMSNSQSGDRSEQFAYIRRLLAENRELSVQLKNSRQRVDEMREARDKLAGQLDEIRDSTKDRNPKDQTSDQSSVQDSQTSAFTKDADSLDRKSHAQRQQWTLSVAIFQILLILLVASVFFLLGGYWNSNSNHCECDCSTLPLSEDNSPQARTEL